jgi:small subunit ribosomal protein S3
VGHKVHPNAFRLGVYRSWEANWFADRKDYTKLLHEDLEMRRLILGRLRNAGIAKIETERSSNAQMTVTIHTAKPGIVIGKGGSSVDQLREDLEKRFGNRVRISIQEIKQPELDAQLVAENIASQIERRISYRRAMKQSILRTMRSGAKGVRVALGGRLRGSEMARREWDREGRVPLHTLRADIDFGRAGARTTFGAIGVKVWIYKDLVKLPPRGGVQMLTAEEAADAIETQVTPTRAGQPEPLVPAGTRAEAPAVAPASVAVAEPVVEPQVAAEEAGTGQRRRAPRAGSAAGKAAEPGPSEPATMPPAPESVVPDAIENATEPGPNPPVEETGAGGESASS